MTNIACIFPGQGSQSIGMGKSLVDNFSVAKEVFEEVDDALGEKLSTVIFEGPEDALTMTANTQPALMATSIATTRVIEEESGKKIADFAALVAGHSLGEYSALCAAGSITLADCAKILRIRGNAMQAAVPQGKGSMAALIGAEFQTAEEIAAAATMSDSDICEIANDNGAGQIVLSGTTGAIDQAITLAGEHGIRRAVKLPVSAPFHCSMMDTAAQTMEEALQNITISAPSVPLIANVTAEKCTDPTAIKKQLVEQVTGSVRWRETMDYFLQNNIDTTLEIGAGKVLSNLMKRTEKSINTLNIAEKEDLDAILTRIA